MVLIFGLILAGKVVFSDLENLTANFLEKRWSMVCPMVATLGLNMLNKWHKHLFDKEVITRRRSTKTLAEFFVVKHSTKKM